MPIEEALNLARLWRAHKLIGGDPYEVCAALLTELERDSRLNITLRVCTQEDAA